jgi:hypothetical protein
VTARDQLRRLGALFTWPTTERRTVLVHGDDPWYLNGPKQQSGACQLRQFPLQHRAR